MEVLSVDDAFPAPSSFLPSDSQVPHTTRYSYVMSFALAVNPGNLFSIHRAKFMHTTTSRALYIIARRRTDFCALDPPIFQLLSMFSGFSAVVFHPDKWQSGEAGESCGKDEDWIKAKLLVQVPEQRRRQMLEATFSTHEMLGAAGVVYVGAWKTLL